MEKRGKPFLLQNAPKASQNRKPRDMQKRERPPNPLDILGVPVQGLRAASFFGDGVGKWGGGYIQPLVALSLSKKPETQSHEVRPVYQQYSAHSRPLTHLIVAQSQPSLQHR
jgi:hypothetical protein